MRLLLLLIVIIPNLLFAQHESAYDPKSRSRNLNRGALIRIDDASPTRKNRTDLEQVYRSESSAEDPEVQQLETNISHGINDDMEVRFSLPQDIGKNRKGGSMDSNIGILRNLHTGETGKIPAIAVSAGLRFPTGQGSQGIGPSAGLILSQSVGEVEHKHRFHLNIAYKNNAHRKKEEATHGYEFAIGYDTPIGERTAFVISAFQESNFFDPKTTRVVELATRTNFSERATFGIAAGRGLDDRSPDARATVSFGYTLFQ